VTFFRAVPLGALLALAPALGSAQVSPATVPPGLTVLGRASIAVPADRMNVVVRLNPRNVTNAALDELAKSVADTMRGAGIADAHEALPLLGTLGPNSQVAVLGTIAHPTRTSVESILRGVMATIPDATATAVGNNYGVTTSLAIDDCDGALARAQAAAFEDARARAARAATAAGVHLGAILAINESNAFTDTACRTNAVEANGIVVNVGPYGGGANDPYGSLNVTISASATVTYALR
jgi:uncharacterized protein YggE